MVVIFSEPVDESAGQQSDLQGHVCLSVFEKANVGVEKQKVRGDGEDVDEDVTGLKGTDVTEGVEQIGKEDKEEGQGGNLEEDELAKVSVTKELGEVEKKDGVVELEKEVKVSENPKPDGGDEDREEEGFVIAVDLEGKEPETAKSKEGSEDSEMKKDREVETEKGTVDAKREAGGEVEESKSDGDVVVEKEEKFLEDQKPEGDGQGKEEVKSKKKVSWAQNVPVSFEGREGKGRQLTVSDSSCTGLSLFCV